MRWIPDGSCPAVAQPGERMGETAAQLLLDEIRDTGEHRHRAVVLEPELIARPDR